MDTDLLATAADNLLEAAASEGCAWCKGKINVLAETVTELKEIHPIAQEMSTRVVRLTAVNLEELREEVRIHRCETTTPETPEPPISPVVAGLRRIRLSLAGSQQLP